MISSKNTYTIGVLSNRTREGRILKRTLIALAMMMVILLGCNKTTGSEQLPKSWIHYNDMKYTFLETVPSEEMKKIVLVPTGEFTDKHDGVKAGMEIFTIKDHEIIYVKDMVDGNEEWLKYEK